MREIDQQSRIEVPVVRFERGAVVPEVRMMTPVSLVGAKDVTVPRNGGEKIAVGRLQDGVQSNMYVLNYIGEEDDETVDSASLRSRGLLYSYGGNHAQKNVISLQEVDLLEGERFEGDALNIVIPTESGSIVDITVLENKEEKCIFLLAVTANGHVFCSTFLHPAFPEPTEGNGNGEDQYMGEPGRLSFLCKRVSNSVFSQAIVSGEIAKHADEVKCVSWQDMETVCFGLLSGRIVVGRIARENCEGGGNKITMKEQVLKDVSLTDRIWSGLGSIGIVGKGAETAASLDFVSSISLCDNALVAVHGNGMMRTWSTESGALMFAPQMISKYASSGVSDPVQADASNERDSGASQGPEDAVVSSALKSLLTPGYGWIHVGHVLFAKGDQSLFYIIGSSLTYLPVRQATALKNFDFGFAAPAADDDEDADIMCELYCLWVQGNGRSHAISRWLSDARDLFEGAAWTALDDCVGLEHMQEAEMTADEYVGDEAERGLLEAESLLGHYKRRIFSSQRFPGSVIIKALLQCLPENEDIHRIADGMASGVENSNASSEEISSVISKAAKERAHSEARASMGKAGASELAIVEKDLWCQILEVCVYLWKRSQTPLGVYYSANEDIDLGMCGLVREGVISRFRTLTDFEDLIVNLSPQEDPSATVLASAQLVTTLFASCSFLAKDLLEQLNKPNGSLIEDSIAAAEPGIFMALAREKIDAITRQPAKGAMEIVQNCLCAFSSDEEDGIFSRALNSLLPDRQRTSHVAVPFRRSATSEMGLAAGELVRKDLSARVAACCSLCIFFAFAKRNRVIENVDKYLDQSLQIFRSYSTLAWLGTLNLLPPRRRVTVALNDDISTYTLGRTQNDTVISVSDDIGKPLLDLWCAEMGVNLENRDYLWLMWPTSTYDAVAEHLSSHGQLQWLAGYSKLLMSECGFGDLNDGEKVCCARRHTHMLGESLLGDGSFPEAMEQFLRAAPLSPSDRRIKYILAIMETFDGFNNPLCVLHCARVAIASIRDHGTGDANAGEGSFLRTIVPTLWSSIFQQTLILGRYDEAFVAILSNPDTEQSKDCVQRLVVELHDKNQLDWLCRLPWETLSLDGLRGIDGVRDILNDRAAHASIGTGENTIYHFLYAFFVRHGSYHKAASAMYKLSQRLLEESYAGGPMALREARTNALSAAVSALRLLPDSEAKIFDHERGEAIRAKRRREEVTEVEMGNGAYDESKIKTGKGIAKVASEDIVGIEQISREFVLEQARTKLRRSHASVARPHETMALLLSGPDSDQHEAAVTVANAYNLGKDKVVRAKAREYFTNAGLVSFTAEKDLKEFLCCFDGLENNYELHASVADELLSLDCRFELPAWLVDSMMGGEGSLRYGSVKSAGAAGALTNLATSGFAVSQGNPSALIRVYLKYGRYYEACTKSAQLVSQIIYILRAALEGDDHMSIVEQWIPQPLIDEVLSESAAVLQEYPDAPESNEIHSGESRLCTALEEYYKLVVTLNDAKLLYSKN